MNVVKIDYQKSKHKNTCFLNSSQLKNIGLSHKKRKILFTIGSQDIMLNIILNKEVDDDIETGCSKLYFSDDVMNNIYIPSNTVMQIRKVGDEHIEIGPLIGVFISPTKIAALIEGKRDSVYEQISYVSNNLYGLCAFFSIGDIDWDKRLIKALLWNDGKWSNCILPLPKVIYDRCFGKNARNDSIKLRKELGREYSIINAAPKLNKWETIIALRKNKKLIDIIPETTLYHTYKDVEEALYKLPSVYLKPDSLYKGKGVYRVSRPQEGSSFKVEHRAEIKNKNLVTYFNDLSEIDKLISNYAILGNGYIIQEEILKACYKGYPFDFRLLLQKDWEGNWQPSGIAVRIAAPGSIITSPRSGGAVEGFSTVIKEVFNEDIGAKNGLYENVITIAGEVADTIEKEFGDFAEIGLDMTIDINKKVWIIEANGKPLKVSLKRLNDPKVMVRSYNRPIEYAVYLTGFDSADTCSGEE